MDKFEKWLGEHPKTASAVCILVAVCVVITCALLSSCNVTRTVTTKAEYYQKGDTTVQIVTRTTESYDGSVKPENLLKK